MNSGFGSEKEKPDVTVLETNQPPMDTDTIDKAQEQPSGPVKMDTPGN